MGYPKIIEAMPLKDFERMEQGLPPRPKKKVVIPEHEPPVVENQIHLENFPDKEITKVEGRMRTVRNKEGVRFTGFNLVVIFSDKSEISGWVLDADFQKLKAILRASSVDTGIGKILG